MGSGGVELLAEEEQSADAEVVHAAQTVTYLVFER